MSTVIELKTIFERNSKANHSLANLLNKIEMLDQRPILHVYEIGTTLDQIQKILPGLSADDQTTKNLNDWVNLRIQKLDSDKKEFTGTIWLSARNTVENGWFGANRPIPRFEG